MKEKHGQYMPLYHDGDGPDEEYVKGHVTLEEAREALNRWAKDFGDGITAVDHKWARWRPVTGFYYDMELTMLDGPARGAFSITEVSFAPAARPTLAVNSIATEAQPAGAAAEEWSLETGEGDATCS